jgi:hypothetical protein
VIALFPVIVGATQLTEIEDVFAVAVMLVGLSGADGRVADVNATYSELPLAFFARIEKTMIEPAVKPEIVLVVADASAVVVSLLVPFLMT